ncbi:hypothetical protein INR49_019110 [Caranx melampygus]|nr:hypothetical protein INR49_019110 [Caranx melampygus]
MSSVKAEDWRRYDCVFSSLSEGRHRHQTGQSKIRTNRGKSDIRDDQEKSMTMAVVVAVVVLSSSSFFCRWIRRLQKEDSRQAETTGRRNRKQRITLTPEASLSSSAGKHSLKIFSSLSSGVTNLPEFVRVVLLDEVEAGYCDSNTNTFDVKQTWVKRLLDEHPEHLQGQWTKTPSSPVSCHATGFYPHRALLFWTKDGEELHEDVDQGEILPNHDGTFQMTVDLDVSSVKAEDWRRYDCVFQLSGVKDDIITKLDKAQIRTNMEKPSNTIISALVPLALVLIAVSGFLVYNRRKTNTVQQRSPRY